MNVVRYRAQFVTGSSKKSSDKEVWKLLVMSGGNGMAADGLVKKELCVGVFGLIGLHTAFFLLLFLLAFFNVQAYAYACN